VGRLLCAFVVKIGDDNIRSRLGECASNRSSYAAASAGNDGYLAG
jgi:hypothetical protein